MKKVVFWAIGLIALSLNSASAAAPKYSPAGNGFYIVGQIGGGVFRISADANAQIYQKGEVKKDGIVYFPSAGLQLNWGFSKRFDNDMTVGFEAAFLSPGVRVGYMIGDTHHISLGAHYGLAGKLIVGSVLDFVKKRMKEEEKKKFKLDFTGLSFAGASICYEHFTAAKNFFRVQLRADYYGIEGSVDANAARHADTIFPLINGKATAWDILVYMGFGSQW